jgi:hypothetical protein
MEGLDCLNINGHTNKCYSDSNVVVHRKDNMLETYVLTLLAIWLTITIIGQLTGGYMGYSLLKNFQDKMAK